MDDGWPMGYVATEETQDIIWIGTMKETTHKIILSGNSYSVRAIFICYLAIQEITQAWCHQFISINNQDPIVDRLMNGKLTGWLDDVVLPIGKGYDTASMPFGYLHRMVCAFHITY